VICPGAEALVVLNRNSGTDELSVRQTVGDDTTSMQGLVGATDVACSSDGRFVYVSSGNFKGDYALSAFQLSSSGRIRLIQEFFDGEERLRDTASGNDIAISRDGRRLYVCSKRRDKLIELERDSGTGRLSRPRAVSVGESGPPEWLTALTVAPDGRHLYAGTEVGEAIVTFATNAAADAAAQVRPVPLPPQQSAATPGAPAPATPSAPPPGQDEVARMTGHRQHVIEAIFSPDGRRAFSGSWDGTLRFWDVATGGQLRSIEVSPQQILAIAGSPDGRLVATAGVDNVIRLWDSQSGELVRQIKGSRGFINGLAFSPDGKRLLSAAGDRKVRLWDVQTGEELRIYDQTMEVLASVAFSPDGRLALCSGGYFNNTKTPLGEMLRVWDLESGNVVFRLQPKVRSVIKQAVFSPDGRSVAAVDLDAHGLGVWDLEKGVRTHLIPRTSGTIQDLAFSPDGRLILTGHAGSRMVLCEVESGRVVREFEGHTGPVQTVALSPDGRYALSGSWDKTLRLWRLPEAVHSRGPPAQPKPPQEATPAGDRVGEGASSSQPPASVPAPVAASAPGNADPASLALTGLYRGQSSLHNIRVLLPTYRPDESQAKQRVLDELLENQQEVDSAAGRLSEVEGALQKRFQERFADLPPLTGSEWRVAQRHKPLEKAIPQDIVFAQADGKTVIRNQSERMSYHVCLDYAMSKDTQLRIRFSLPPPQRRPTGGPAYYGSSIGLRDENGQEQDLFSFPPRPASDDVHEVLVERYGDLYTAMYKERARGTAGYPLPRFKSPPFVFFQVGPGSELVVHSIHGKRESHKMEMPP
jgi:WD40 repeat protein